MLHSRAEAKVNKFNLSFVVNKDILKFEVTMYNTKLMEVRNSFYNLSKNIHSIFLL